ncbi:hypothetical protein GCM10022215_36550 [Nocardioides fonticola]|uniref:Uncharacterized protein n=1 Tax=Nocardioides fonticola TaxID=450363 RepID=A0ABP7XVP5_9ACTN
MTRPDDLAPGDLQHALDEIAATVAADPELAASLRGVLRHLGSQPFDVACYPE